MKRAFYLRIGDVCGADFQKTNYQSNRYKEKSEKLSKKHPEKQYRKVATPKEKNPGCCGPSAQHPIKIMKKNLKKTKKKLDFTKVFHKKVRQYNR